MEVNAVSDSPKKPDQNRKPGKKAFFISSAFKCLLLFAGATVLILGLFITVCTPKKYDLHVGSISHETINATKDIVDEVTTEEKKAAAAATVEPTYHFQEGVKEEVLSSLNGIFSELRTVQQYGLTLRSEDISDSSLTFSDEEIDYALGLVSTVSLTRYQITTLLRIDTASFEEMVSTVTTAVENSLNTTIREGQVSQAIQTILQIVGYKLDISLTQNILPTILRTCIKPNMIIDQEATEEARQKARDAVDSVLFLQGQNIIREGDRITNSQLSMLRSLGLLNDEAFDYTTYLGAALCVLLSMLCLLMMLYLLCRNILSDLRRMTVILSVMIICVFFAVIARLLPSIYIIPVSLGSILITVLINYRAGISVTVSLALLISSLSLGSSNSLSYDVVVIFSMMIFCGISTVWFLKGHPQRVRVLLSGLISTAAGLGIVVAIKLLASTDSIALLPIAMWSLAGSLLSGILAVALQPLYETIFQLPTPSKLLELTNPNQPLMRRLLIEAPGTYHHSIIVANLAEAAASRIDANPYLARAGAYYHDVGKLMRPGYFGENQMGENPHDKTDPYVSAAILINHAKDGMLLAQKERIPAEVQDIILQHHGDTPVMFFYHKALQMSDGNQVDINDFRYGGPRPQTKEAAIVMLADTIEAAVRSMKDPTPKSIDQNIVRLVRGKLEDGQLAESPLTLSDLDEICAAFSSILLGVFHERIEYPDIKTTSPARPSAAQKPQQMPAPQPAAVSQPESEQPAKQNEAVNPAPVQQEHDQSEIVTLPQNPQDQSTDEKKPSPAENVQNETEGNSIQ